MPIFGIMGVKNSFMRKPKSTKKTTKFMVSIKALMQQTVSLLRLQKTCSILDYLG